MPCSAPGRPGSAPKKDDQMHAGNGRAAPERGRRPGSGTRQRQPLGPMIGDSAFGPARAANQPGPGLRASSRAVKGFRTDRNSTSQRPARSSDAICASAWSRPSYRTDNRGNRYLGTPGHRSSVGGSQSREEISGSHLRPISGVRHGPGRICGRVQTGFFPNDTRQRCASAGSARSRARHKGLSISQGIGIAGVRIGSSRGQGRCRSYHRQSGYRTAADRKARPRCALQCFSAIGGLDNVVAVPLASARATKRLSVSSSSAMRIRAMIHSLRLIERKLGVKPCGQRNLEAVFPHRDRDQASGVRP